MFWNRFDIAAAYYHFSYTLPTIGISNEQKAYAEQLERLGYEPGELRNISPNAKMIYMKLVKKHFKM